MKQNANGQIYLAAHLRDNKNQNTDQLKIWAFIIALAVIVGVGQHIFGLIRAYMPF